MSSVEEVADYIWRRSPEYNVNPSTALGIARYEGLNPNTLGSQTFGNPDARGYSFGPFQLYSGSSDPNRIAPGGMAYEFLQKYGQPPSRNNWQQQVDFSLEMMAKRGTSPWYAVRDRGGVDKITELGSQYARSLGFGGGQPQTPPQTTQFVAAPSRSSSPSNAPAPTEEKTDTAAQNITPQERKDFETFRNLSGLGLSMMAAQQPRYPGLLAAVGNRPRRKLDLSAGGLLD
jgi:hypothetical protein